MSNIALEFVFLFVMAILFVFYVEYFKNKNNKTINERKLRFYRICLDILTKIDEV